MFQRTAITSLLVLGLTTAALHGQDQPQAEKDEEKFFTVGDKAPALDIEHWVIGDKVAEFEEGKVYIVEFWATWCPPCRASMPHLTELQQKYKDYGLTIIGVSDESLDVINEFLEKDHPQLNKPWREVVQYRLTTDPDGSVYKDYFYAAGQQGIPTSFIVGKTGEIEWIGHPMSMDKPLESVINDTWDRETFRATWEQQQAPIREQMRAQRALRAAMEAEDWDRVLALLDKQIEKSQNALRPRMQKFELLLSAMNRPDEGYAFGEELAKDEWDNPMLLNAMAWFVVDEPGIETRNLDFAMKLAKRANELTQEQDASIIDTVARVYFEKGDLKEAIRLQKKAVELAPEQMAEYLKQTLKEYEEQAKQQG